ncbi:hypothetical protein [Stenotrophomonas sp. 24(2023)]|uniref:hypothetical protein n=1 Tax=Stenotrophomonas sp. 24(2023) TaxID=3068324 RepID=UPI0027E1F21B|nr:hypothetical protein [Stenotrophomonas sp. 24(2023)]WMJ67680.1 hypothetical protein Q9R17_10615 [Stenotrophomonas sp. 24(2023)]
MSKSSKAKRDQRKKQQAKRPFLRLNGQQQVQNHAVLTNEEGHVVAAIGLQGRQWLLAIGGQTMGNAENPVPMLAMLQHLANVQEKEGRKVTLEYSDLIKQLLAALAADAGQTPEEYLAAQVAEFEKVQAEDEVDAAVEGESAQDEAVAETTDAAPAAEGDDAAKPQA